MIAAGLCLMGGCFAQNEHGACVDSYWSASACDIPKYGAVNLMSGRFPGGSSEADTAKASIVCEWKGSTDQHNIITGYNSFYSNSTYLGGWGVRRAGNSMADLVYTPILSPMTFSSDYPELQLYCADGRAWVESAGALLASTETEFSLTMEQMRAFSIRCTYLRQFHYMAYANEQTGIKWNVLPVRSPLGNAAIWEDYTNSLIEL